MELRFLSLAILSISWAAILSETWGNPIRFSPLGENETITSLQARNRFKRSCGPGVHLLILGACNKNHKRSPIIMSLIFEYFADTSTSPSRDLNADEASVTEILMIPNGNPRHSDSKNMESSMMITTNSFLIEDLMGPYFQMDEVYDESRHLPNSHATTVPRAKPNRHREQRTKRSPDHVQSITEKCCSSVGCSELDFLHFCF